MLWGGPPEAMPEAASDEAERQEAHIDCNFCLYHKDGLTKNDPFRHMLDTASKRGLPASERGLASENVVFDSWYSALVNLKKVRACQWHFFTRLKSNRLVNPDDTHNRAVREVDIQEDGCIVHLKGFGFVSMVHDSFANRARESGQPCPGVAVW
jgi:hypothetical protein